MASKNHNRPISKKLNLDKGFVVVVDKRHSIGGSNMVGPANAIRNRQVFSIVNGAQDLAVTGGEPASSAGSDYGGATTEFTKDEVDALLTEKMKTKNKFNLKVSLLGISGLTRVFKLFLGSFIVAECC